MQIIIVALLTLAFIAFIIFKINGQFAKKEAIILGSVVIVTILVFTMYQKNQSDFLPNAFKKEYKKINNIEIQKLSSELLNNKNISSKKNFVYKFTYIIQKEGKEFLCTASNVQINKIEDEYVFSKWNEQCTQK